MKLYEVVALHSWVWDPKTQLRNRALFDRLLEEGADVNEVYIFPDSTTRDTPLLRAVRNCAVSGKDYCVRQLVQYGADVNAVLMLDGEHLTGHTNSRGGDAEFWAKVVGEPEVFVLSGHGKTPLHAVATESTFHTDVAVRTLIELGANPYWKDAEGDTALDAAIREKVSLAAIALLDAGFDLSRSRRYVADPDARQWLERDGLAEYAVRRGDAVRLRQALERGASPEGHAFEPLLFIALRGGHSHLVSVLLEGGADPHQKRYHDTAIRLAVRRQAADAVQALIRAGVGVYPELLREAAGGEGSAAVIRTLLAAGLDVDAREEGGTTALQRAIRCDDNEAVRELLRAGADPNVTDSHGTTALMEACRSADAATVGLLQVYGADYRARDRRGADWRGYTLANEKHKTAPFVVRFLKGQRGKRR